MDFAIANLMDEDACYAKLLRLPRRWFRCPRRGSGRYGVHRKHRAPVLDHRCRDCRAGFNAFTGAAFRETDRPTSALVLILRGFARGVPTEKLARELWCDRMKLLKLRHRIQGHALAGLAREPQSDPVMEADECYINAGEKRPAAPAAG